MTIFALSSGGGRAGVAVVRISGARSGAAIEAITDSHPPPPRQATYTRFWDPSRHETIDHGILLWFPRPHSYTGEDVAELHVHGGTAVVSAVLSALAAVPGLRPAEPGEFTRRAFENGKFDLTQSEAIADLVNAETEAQRRQALRQLDGTLGELYERWREVLLNQLAHIEVFIDFPDEDIPADIETGIAESVAQIVDEVRNHLDDDRRGERLRAGFYVAILGAPNVGKSSLLNCLAQRDAAIVAETLGTTRDVIEIHLDLDGYPITVADTAGLRLTTDDVESEGVRRSHARARTADLKIAMFSAETLREPDRHTADLVDEATIVVINKIDLFGKLDPVSISGHEAICISVKTGENLDSLTNRLALEIEKRFSPTAAPSITRQRHRQALVGCVDSLIRALEQFGREGRSELAAEDLRLAVRSLGSITGVVDIEDLLDIVFADFCIGK